MQALIFDAPVGEIILAPEISYESLDFSLPGLNSQGQWFELDAFFNEKFVSDRLDFLFQRGVKLEVKDGMESKHPNTHLPLPFLQQYFQPPVAQIYAKGVEVSL